MFDGAFEAETTQYIEAFDMNNFNDDDNDVHYSFVHDKNRAGTLASVSTTRTIIAATTTITTMSSTSQYIHTLLVCMSHLPPLMIVALAITIILQLVPHFYIFSFSDVSIINVL